MENKDFNTICLAADFESSVLTFTKKHAQMIRGNLEDVRKLESNFFASMQELDTRYSQETEQANNSTNASINDAIASYNRTVDQAKKEFEAKQSSTDDSQS